MDPRHFSAIESTLNEALEAVCANTISGWPEDRLRQLLLALRQEAGRRERVACAFITAHLRQHINKPRPKHDLSPFES
jgi:hypothetical protein